MMITEVARMAENHGLNTLTTPTHNPPRPPRFATVLPAYIKILTVMWASARLLDTRITVRIYPACIICRA